MRNRTSGGKPNLTVGSTERKVKSMRQIIQDEIDDEIDEELIAQFCKNTSSPPVTKQYDLTTTPDLVKIGVATLTTHRDGTTQLNYDYTSLCQYINCITEALVCDGTYWYKDENGGYTTDLDTFYHIIIWLKPDARDRERRDIYSSCRLMAKERPMAAWYYATFQGPREKMQILDLRTWTIVPRMKGDGFSPNIIPCHIPTLPNGEIDWNYKDATMEKWLDDISCGDGQTKMQIEEMTGYPILRRSEYRVAYVIKGEKANGKSTYMDVLRELYGNSNASSLDLKDFSDRFSTVGLLGKLINLGDDISDAYTEGRAVSTFKSIVSGNMIKMERKGMDIIQGRPYCKCIFSANVIPKLNDKTGAAEDRMLIVPFLATFNKGDPGYDPFIKDKLTTPQALQGLLIHGLRGLQRILTTNNFTYSNKSLEAIRDYEIENSVVKQWLSDTGCLETWQALIGDRPEETYQRFRDYIDDYGLKPISRRRFEEELTRAVPLKIGNPLTTYSDGSQSRAKRYMVDKRRARADAEQYNPIWGQEDE